MSKEISLTQGMVAIVDDSDYAWLSQWKWHAHKSRSQWYAVRWEGGNGKSQMVRMHRVIINAPDGIIVDHINRSSLDNRRENLRLATRRENLYNSDWYENPRLRKTGEKGVRITASLRKLHGNWTVTLTASRVKDRDTADAMRHELLSLVKQLTAR